MKYMVGAIWQFVYSGWKAMSHASTASWALSLLPSGITSALLAALAWIEHLPGAVVLLIFVVIFAIIFLCTLAWLGRREQQRCYAPPSKEIDLHQFLRFVGIDPMDQMSRIPPKFLSMYSGLLA